MRGNRNLAVGLFVLVAIGLFLVSLFWITGKRGSEPVADYTVLIDSDVSGLMLGGPVFFMGVQVGTVTDLQILPGNPATVRVDIQVLESTPVNSLTWATLAAQGITGVSVINLASEPGAHEPLAPAEGGLPPVIPYRDSGFSALLSSAPAVLNRMESLLANANALLNEDNRAAVAAALANVQRLSETLVAQDQAIASLPGKLDAVLDEVQGVVREVNGWVEETGPEASAAVANLEAATARLGTITNRLDGWLARHEADLDAFGAEGLGQVPALLGDTRDAMRELEKLLEEIRQEPSQALYQTPSEAIEVEE